MRKTVRNVRRGEEGYIHRIERAVTFEGDLTTEQLTRLQEIAHKCPVHKTLSSKIVISDLKSENLRSGI